MQGKPYAGNPHVRFDEGAGAQRHLGRSALLYKMNRIQKCFERTRAAGRPAFIAYLTMGYPTLATIRAAVNMPIAAGFGISTKEQVKVIGEVADGFIVGSALVKMLAKDGKIHPDELSF